MKYAKWVSPSSICCKCHSSSQKTMSRNVCSGKFKRPHKSYAYSRIKSGLKKSNPAAIVLWAFHNLPSQNGLTSRRVIGFLKKHYKAINNPKNTGKSIGTMMRCAVDFGLLKKRGNKFYLAPKTRM